MVSTPLEHLVESLRQVVSEPASDAELLSTFVAARSELAFAEMVRRHGPMVWGVCRRIVRHQQDAEDCYQATFLVLIRKADTVLPRARLGAWLYGVAYHTALKARQIAARRGRMELQMETLPEPAVRSEKNTEWKQMLDRGLCELPEKYRLAIVLCDLEGRALKDVARELGCPIGTLSGWLTRGRDLLARRLAKHRAALSVGALAGLVTEQARAAPPIVAKGIASSTVLTLAKATMRTLFLTRAKSWLATAAVLLLVCGLGGWLYHTLASPPPTGLDGRIDFQEIAAPDKQPREEKEDTAWGKEVEGVRYGVAFKEPRNTYRIGEQVTFVLKARNVSKTPTRFQQVEITAKSLSAPFCFGATVPKVVDLQGKERKAMHIPNTVKGSGPVAKINSVDLAPGEQTILGEVTYQIGVHDSPPYLDTPIGTYHVYFDTVCWLKGHQRPTGRLMLHVVDPVAWGPKQGNLEFGVSLAGGKSTFEIGDKFEFHFHVRNAGKEAVSFEQYRIAFENETLIKGADPTLVPVFESPGGKVTPGEWNLPAGIVPMPPKQSIKVNAGANVALGSIDWQLNHKMRNLHLDPGHYSVYFKTIMGGTTRPTGKLAVQVVLPPGNAFGGWGKEVDGLRFGVEFKNRFSTRHVGQSVTFVLKAANVTDKAITFEQVGITGVQSLAKSAIGAATPRVVDAKGQPVPVYPLVLKGDPAEGKVHMLIVPAGETIVLGEVTYGLRKEGIPPRIEADPGVYKVSFDTVCWLPGHQRPTGVVIMKVLPKD